MSFRLTPLAEADIEDIVLYIAGDSPAAALRWHDEMLSHCRNLGAMPEIGVARPDVRPDLRLLPVGNYLVLYRQVEDGAEIIRVIHGARQWWEMLI